MNAENFCWRPLTEGCDAWRLPVIEVTMRPDRDKANGLVSLLEAHPKWNYRGVFWRPAAPSKKETGQ